MSQSLPYRLTTTSGNQFEFEFPLHEETVSPMQVSQLLAAVLGALDREIKMLGPVGNGDLLQALAMALAARGQLLPVPQAQRVKLIRELLESALSAPVSPAEGNLPPDAPREVH